MGAQYTRIGTLRFAIECHFAHVTALLQWPMRVHFTHLERYGGSDLPTRLCICHVNEIETVSMLEPWLAGRQPKG